MLTLSSSAIKSALLYLWTMSWTRQKASWHWAWGLACCIPQMGLALVLIAGKAVSPGLCFSNQEGQFSTWERLVSWATSLSPPGRNNVGRNSGSFCEWFFRQPQLTEALSSQALKAAHCGSPTHFPILGLMEETGSPCLLAFPTISIRGNEEQKSNSWSPKQEDWGFYVLYQSPLRKYFTFHLVLVIHLLYYMAGTVLHAFHALAHQLLIMIQQGSVLISSLFCRWWNQGKKDINWLAQGHAARR